MAHMGDNMCTARMTTNKMGSKFNAVTLHKSVSGSISVIFS